MLMNSDHGAERIRSAMREVSALRHRLQQAPGLELALYQIKTFQCNRFASTYNDLLTQPAFAPACNFFLEKIYSPKDFEQRDAEFAKIAGALERLFPQSIVKIAVTLADLHALTEQLDIRMAQTTLATQGGDRTGQLTEVLYREIWQKVGSRDDRIQQLTKVMLLGTDLEKVVRLPGIRLTLRTMRGPAKSAKLSQLQAFLETGFETFAALAKVRHGVEGFLAAVHQRESHWIQKMYHPEFGANQIQK